MSRNEIVEVDVDLIRETASALLVKDADGVEHWLPQSMIQSVRGSMGESGTVELPLWLAEDRGLV